MEFVENDFTLAPDTLWVCVLEFEVLETCTTKGWYSLASQNTLQNMDSPSRGVYYIYLFYLSIKTSLINFQFKTSFVKKELGVFTMVEGWWTIPMGEGLVVLTVGEGLVDSYNGGGAGRLLQWGRGW